MTHPRPTKKPIWLSGFSWAWKQLTITLGFTSGNSQLFPGPPESLVPDRFSCCPRDLSLFIYQINTHDYAQVCLISLGLGVLILALTTR